MGKSFRASGGRISSDRGRSVPPEEDMVNTPLAHALQRPHLGGRSAGRAPAERQPAPVNTVLGPDDSAAARRAQGVFAQVHLPRAEADLAGPARGCRAL